MAKKGKKYQDALKQIDANKVYTAEEAVELAKKIDFAKFDATVEVAFRLGVDPKKRTNKSAVLLYYQTVLVKLNAY